jgi:hypothetical protein
MQYALLIYSAEETWAALTEDERSAMYAEYGAFTQELQSAGAMVSGAPLEAVGAATTVRTRGGETLTTDGPFAETKEQLGGFYIVDVDSLDEALEWAAKVPSVRHGSIEVRPVAQMTTENLAAANAKATA